MRIPARYVAGNLIFTLEGEVWALYRVTGPTYAHLSTKEKLAWHTRVSGALMSLPGESSIIGVTQPIDAAAIAMQMIDGVDLKRYPRWADMAAETYDALVDAGLTERVTYLAVCLPPLHGTNRASEILGAATARFTSSFGIAALPASKRLVAASADLARDISGPLDSLLGNYIAPATETDIEWVYARASLRGLHNPHRSEFDLNPGKALTPARLAGLGEPVLFEGGDDTDGSRATRRYVRIDSEMGTTYQTFAVISRMPAQFTFPGGRGELLAHLDDGEIPIDWCVRIKPMANIAARRAINTSIRQLVGQVEEYGGDAAGPPESLSEAIDDLRGLIGKLNGSPSTPECQTTFVLSFAAPTLEQLEADVMRVRALLEANEFGLPRPLGQQSDLWGAMLPGSGRSSVLKEYAQYMLPDDIAGCAPFTGTDLGDKRGGLLALNMDARGKPVLFWAGTGPNMAPPEGPKAGSVGVWGSLGGGKSFFIKRLIIDIVAMGGRFITTDRTPMGEYVILARALERLGHSVEVLSLDDSSICIDPLLVFKGDMAVRVGTGFLTLLTGTDPTEPEGAMLEEAVRRVQARGGRLRDAAEELFATDDPAFIDAAKNVALKLRVFVKGGLARVVFGDGTPVSLNADFSVFHAPSLQLPSAEALKDRRQLMPEHIVAQGLMYLVTAVARDVAFRDRHQFVGIGQDEGYVLDNPQGRELVGEILRDGRKHDAALIFGSHDPSDLSEKLRRLILNHFLFRIDRNAAPDALRTLGMEVSPATIELISDTNQQRGVGQCLFRDLYGRVGLVQILEPRSAELREAMDTGLSNVHASVASRRRRPRVGDEVEVGA